jgi:hypothetical protein
MNVLPPRQEIVETVPEPVVVAQRVQEPPLPPPPAFRVRAGAMLRNLIDVLGR